MESLSWNPKSLVIDYTTRIHDTLRGLDAVEAERALRKFREELELRMIELQTREIDDACFDGLDLALAAHVASDVRSDVLHGLKAQYLEHKRNLDHEPQKRDDTLSALAKLTVLWGGTILNFYGFVDLGRSTAMPLAIVAKAYPHWQFAVQRINVAMLSRHIANITECTGYSIGNHHSTSHVSECSPGVWIDGRGARNLPRLYSNPSIINRDTILGFQRHSKLSASSETTFVVNAR